MGAILQARGDVEQTIDEQFFALVCSDEQLLRAQFEEIVAAEWPTLRPGPGRAAGPERSGRRAGRWSRSGGHLPTRPRHPGVGAWVRQRSPPAVT
jgi:hypothetical protein